MPTKIKVLRQARNITVKGGDEVYTRYSKREYELRRDLLAEESPDHLANYDYEEWTEWGAQGGRPRKWNSATERMRAKRAQKKLALGKPLTLEERKLLGLTKSRPGTYRSSLGRALTPAERKARWRKQHGR